METQISRKQILGWSAAAFAALASQSVLGNDHDHKKEGKKSSSKKNGTGSLSKVPTNAVEAASQCIVKGQICINMCIDFLEQGHKEMADCLRSVEETTALCDTFIKLSTLKSPSTKKIAAICLDSCERCAAQCDKHADHHEECKECSDACKTCISEFKKILAA